MECSVCKARAASATCAECGTPTCEDCGLQCPRCKAAICPQHVYVTPGGRGLCKDCMAKRSEAAAERKRKHREKVSGAMKGAIEESVRARSEKAESLSFEALMDGVTTPATKTTEKAGSSEELKEEKSQERPEPQAPQAPPKERELDPDRPILTSSMKSRRSTWPYIPVLLLAVGAAYFVYTRVPSLRMLVVAAIGLAIALLLGRAYFIHKAREEAPPDRADVGRHGR